MSAVDLDGHRAALAETTATRDKLAAKCCAAHRERDEAREQVRQAQAERDAARENCERLVRSFTEARARSARLVAAARHTAAAFDRFDDLRHEGSEKTENAYAALSLSAADLVDTVRENVRHVCPHCEHHGGWWVAAFADLPPKCRAHAKLAPTTDAEEADRGPDATPAEEPGR